MGYDYSLIELGTQIMSYVAWKKVTLLYDNFVHIVIYYT